MRHCLIYLSTKNTNITNTKHPYYKGISLSYRGGGGGAGGITLITLSVLTTIVILITQVSNGLRAAPRNSESTAWLACPSGRQGLAERGRELL
jgi:hypothetical protein